MRSRKLGKHLRNVLVDSRIRNRKFVATCGLLLGFLSVLGAENAESDAALYGSACAACHGDDGRGRSQEDLGFTTPLPDFTDCRFASREPDADWYAVIHEGGPVRAFDRMMPAFGDALTHEQIYSILRHVRTFCTESSWPRGEFNLPRPLYTEKAYPEDEIVVTSAIDPQNNQSAEFEYLYEKRFGPRGMIEVALPFIHRDAPADISVGEVDGEANFGIGDVSLGYKHTLYHNLERGKAFALGGEVIFPSGSARKGLGSDSTVLEPYIAFAQLLPSDSFVQLQALTEFTLNGVKEDEMGLRVAFGRTITEGEFGRAWSPMLELLASRELVDGAETRLDLAPQVQISLNTRQHILLNIGLRVPLTNTADRDTEFVVYLLWDWFDGGFFDGW